MDAGQGWVLWAQSNDLDRVSENVRDRACALAYRPGSVRYEFGARVNACVGADPEGLLFISHLLGTLAINIAANRAGL